GRWVEVEPPGVEAFAEGVLVLARRRWWRGPWGLGSGPGRPDGFAVPVGEGDTARRVGVAADAQLTAVVPAVVLGAESDQIPRFGRAVVLPVDDVVDLDVVGLVAAGYPASLVA